MTWSPDAKHVAFTLSMPQASSCGRPDVDGAASRVGKVILNLTLPGAPFHWLPDNNSR